MSDILATLDRQFADPRQPADAILLAFYQLRRHLDGRTRVLEWQLARKGEKPFTRLVGPVPGRAS